MSKLFKIFLLLFLPFSMLMTVNASNDGLSSDFTIDVPDGYIEVVKNNFAKQDGNNFNIQITEVVVGNFSYTEEILNQTVDEMSTQMDELLDQNRDALREQYEGVLTEEEVDEIIDSIEYKGVVSKEITSFTKNNYPSFHYVISYSMNDVDYSAEIYQTISGSKLYTLTFTEVADNYLESDEVKDIVDSFTIENYNDTTASGNEVDEDFTTKLVCYIALGLGIGIVIGLGFILLGKKKKDNTENQNL